MQLLTVDQIDLVSGGKAKVSYQALVALAQAAAATAQGIYNLADMLTSDAAAQAASYLTDDVIVAKSGNVYWGGADTSAWPAGSW